MAKKRILVIGSSNMDFSMNLSKIPELGETLIDDGGVAYTPGGKGANAAIAFTKLGADCTFATKLGADLHGQKLYKYYTDMGIDTKYIRVDHDHPTGLAIVMREGDVGNRIVVYPGANAYMTTDGVISAFECNPDAVYLGFEIPFSTALSAAKIAAAKDIPVFIDAAPASKEHDLDNLPPIEIFSPNETETFEYTGIMPTTMEASLRAAFALSRRVKAKYIVIKQGARGAFCYDGVRYNTYPAIRSDKVVDTTAAGDTFTSALTLEYVRNGGDIEAAIRYANAAASIAVSRYGASSSVPTGEEVYQLLASKS